MVKNKLEQNYPGVDIDRLEIEPLDRKILKQIEYQLVVEPEILNDRELLTTVADLKKDLEPALAKVEKTPDETLKGISDEHKLVVIDLADQITTDIKEAAKDEGSIVARFGLIEFAETFDLKDVREVYVNKLKAKSGSLGN